MKIFFACLLFFPLINSLKTHSSLTLSQISKLRSEFKQQNVSIHNLPPGRELSVTSLTKPTCLKMKSTYSPFKIDRYLKPVLPRNLENSEDELENETAPKVLKIEEINEKTGKVERVLHSSFQKPQKRQNQEKVKLTAKRNLRKVVGFHHETPKSEIKQEEKKEEEKKEEPKIGYARIAALYKNNVHVPFADYVEKHNKVRERFEFGKNDSSKKRK